jgi:hypothetical protein
MFGFLRSVAVAPSIDEQMAEAKNRIDLQEAERMRKCEDASSPLAREIARMLREKPEEWTPTEKGLVHRAGLVIRTVHPASPYGAVTMWAEKGSRSSVLSSDDIAVISHAKQHWHAWRNKRDAGMILAELTNG